MNFISAIRKKGRLFYDSFYCKKSSTKKEIGTGWCSWFVDTKSLGEESIVYSGGAGNDISFELEIAELFGCRVLLFDPSETGINTVKKADTNRLLDFYAIGLTKTDGEVTFSKPANSVEGSFSIEKNDHSTSDKVTFSCKSISSLMKEFNHRKIDLLKIDIEGFEYGVLEDILHNKLAVDQICVEFHHFFKEIPKAKTSKIIQLLELNGYKIIHKKNLDYTFIKDA